MPEEKLEEQQQQEVSTDIEYICKTCQWWSRCKPLPGMEEVWGLEMFHFGECRASPPTALGQDKQLVAPNDSTGGTTVNIKLSRFPHTNFDDWCGFWKSRPVVEKR
jgi:hypothetical protein